MIIDKINNISNYNNIPKEVCDFLKGLDKSVKLGRYDLSGGNYVNVEAYLTKNIHDAKFESHKKYADIQVLLDGSERIYYRDLANLTEIEPYDEVRDITFYNQNVQNSDYVTIDSSNFVMIFPHEAHAPQVSTNSEEKVLKVVAKILL